MLRTDAVRQPLHSSASFIALNALGGIAVLGSYFYGVMLYTGDAGAAWGGVPDALRPLYIVSMFTAAAGYFPMTAYVLFGLSRQVRLAGGLGWGAFLALYALILVPSALWMPLTFAHLEAPSPGLWLLIRLVLFAVGFASLGVLTAFLTADPPGAPKLRRWAIVGAVAFCFQTAVLDALVWPVYFPA
ncbi:MAG: hypothetical protein OEP95_07715 [Myxococcales bacterium]|nr:hypothetical protein [Myxococcales bacterium]